MWHDFDRETSNGLMQKMMKFWAWLKSRKEIKKLFNQKCGERLAVH